MNIIGAGMAGLLAANYFRKLSPVVWEAQKSLPHNHEALLRFKTLNIARVAGMPFREVNVRKAIVYEDSFLDHANMHVCNQYSLKTTGRILNRSIWDLEPGKRYIAPKNMIQLLSHGIDIKYDSAVNKEALNLLASAPVISTIPMPIMMEIQGWKDRPNFQYQPIWAITFDLIKPVCDVYQTIYYPDLRDPVYRASVTGDRVTIESVSEIDQKDAGNIINKILDTFGIPSALVLINELSCKKQPYGKIAPIAEDARQEFIYWLSRERNIYSLGRFATWRQLLLDDLVHDLQVIEKLTYAENRRSKYFQALAETKQVVSGTIN